MIMETTRTSNNTSKTSIGAKTWWMCLYKKNTLVSRTTTPKPAPNSYLSCAHPTPEKPALNGWTPTWKNQAASSLASSASSTTVQKQYNTISHRIKKKFETPSSSMRKSLSTTARKTPNFSMSTARKNSRLLSRPSRIAGFSHHRSRKYRQHS